MTNPPTQLLEENSHSIRLPEYREKLKRWGRDNLRSFPWRETCDPYRVLIAEFMLIRTQAKQVAPVYLEFVDRFPTLADAADASPEEIQDILSPLGLSWRADRVYETLQKLQNRGEGVPQDRKSLLSLPGVSQYVAGAVRCFAFGKPDPLIDANTVRIAGRIFGLEIKSSSRRNSTFRSLIGEMTDLEDPRLYNLSMLDLGAKICTSQSPSCRKCPLAEMCSYGQEILDQKKRREN